MLLGLGAEFEDHCQRCDTRGASFGSLGAEPDRSKGRFDRIGGAQMRPVPGREVVKSKEPIFVFLQPLGRFWILGLIAGNELIKEIFSVGSSALRHLNRRA